MNKTIRMALTALLVSGLETASAATAPPRLQNDTLPEQRKEHPMKDMKPQQKDGDHKKGDPKKPEEKKKNEYDELIKKKGSVQQGLFTVRHIENKWYFDVHDSLLGRYLLAVTRYTSVPQNYGKFAGEQLNEATLYFEKRDKNTMLLRAYVLTQLADDKDQISKTLQASTVDPIVAAFKIIGPHKDKQRSLIEVTSLFNKDNALMSETAGTTTAKKGGLMADRTFIDTMKVFPINVEVASTRTYSATPSRAQASKTGALTLGLNTSIVLLPREPMRKRLWDKRVGYFTSAFTQFSDDQRKTDHEQFISRYRLVPKNKKAYAKGELVEPEKQIVYYIDPATPRQWVPYLKAGIDDWNVAFEAAGFKNAIVAKEWPEDDPDMSVDDARYCVLRYLPSEAENAYGPRIVDPRSGEIIESHICWYHNVMNLLTKWYMTQCGPLDKRARTMKFDDELMGQLIRFVSSHEVGHTLGLRHNMGASSATPVDKLRDKAWVEAHGHTVSIMDYARFNYVAQPEDGISERGLFPRINDYDRWAIKWGYQYRPEFKDEFEEKERLMTETTGILAKNPRLWFSGEGRDEDPRSQTEDLGDDNMKASDYGVKNLQRVISGLPEWTRQDNYQYENLLEMYGAVRDQFKRYVNHVIKNIGGRHINNLPGTTPYEVAPTWKQQAAVDWIGRQLFEAPVWLYPSGLVEKSGIDAAGDLSAQQSRALGLMMGGALLDKIYANSFSAARPYTLEAYLSDVFNTVWKPLNGKDELANRCRRMLQRAYIDNLNKLINATAPKASTVATATAAAPPTASRAANTDALLYVWSHLDTVEQHCKAQQAKSNGLNALHYQDLLRQLKQIRDKKYKAD